MRLSEARPAARTPLWQRLWRAEADRAVLWLPVCLGAGVWAYFALADEPPVWAALAPLAPLVWLLSGRGRVLGALSFAPALALAAVATGFASGMVSARLAAAPVLPGMVEETVDGRVVALSRSRAGAPRITLSDVTVYGLARADTPARLRISLLDTALDDAPRPGARVRIYARMFPPGGPVEPGAYDFARSAHFARLGGVGYAQGPVLALPPAASESLADRARLWLAGVRARIADGLRNALPGPEGAFAAAIVVGERAGIAEPDAEALRAANLAHLLAISGLHMGILCGLVFAVVRGLAALLPDIGLRLSGKKLAAVTALAAGAAYLALSGATVATQRAFVMAAVALVAVLLDRPALTLRALAVAAAIVLLLRPVSLHDAGFQMSFAATAALVAVFEALRGRPGQRSAKPRGRGSRLLRAAGVYVGALVLTSVVAGAATAPFAAAQFNRVPLYGLPANLLAVPLMGLVIAPMAVLSAMLAPVGLAGPSLTAMGMGIAGVLEVARMVAAWPDAVRLAPAAPPGAVALVVLGGLWLVLWRSPMRLIGLSALAAGLALWWAAPARPVLLIAPGARLVGLMGPEGRAVDHPRAQGFAAETWLQRDGDGAAQEIAAARPGLEHGRGWAQADLPDGWRLEVLHGRRVESERLRALCRPRTILVARHGPPISGPCCYLGARQLAAAGAISIRLGADGLDLTPARRGPRLWSPAPALSGGALNRCG